MTTQKQTDANAFLMGGGAKSATFKNIGDTVQGMIMSCVRRQQTEPGGELKFWKNGDPMEQLVITLMTQESDDEDDDGLRAVYVKGQLQSALRAAVLKSGEHGIEEGGELFVRFTSELPQQVKGHNPTKQYKVGYRPPARQVAIPDHDGPQVEDDDSLPF